MFCNFANSSYYLSYSINRTNRIYITNKRPLGVRCQCKSWVRHLTTRGFFILMKQEKLNLNIGIYAIKTNDGKILYIGCSYEIEKRFKNHYSLLKNNNHDNYLLQEISNKIGFDNLTFTILKYSKIEDLFFDEMTFIKINNPLCNVANYEKHTRKIDDVLISIEDIKYIESFNLELSVKHKYNTLNLKNIHPKTFNKKLKIYCKLKGYQIKRGNSSGYRFFIINTIS